MAFPFCFSMRPLHTALLPKHHRVEPLKEILRVEERRGFRREGADAESVVSGRRTRDEVSLLGAGLTVWRLKVCIDQPVFFSLKRFRPPRYSSSQLERCKVPALHLSSRLPASPAPWTFHSMVTVTLLRSASACTDVCLKHSAKMDCP